MNRRWESGQEGISGTEFSPYTPQESWGGTFSPTVTEQAEHALRGDLKRGCYKKKTTFASLGKPMSLLELDLPYNEMAAA